LVKQIEIGDEAVKVVYRIDSLPFVQAPEGGILQHCRRRYHTTLSKSDNQSALRLARIWRGRK